MSAARDHHKTVDGKADNSRALTDNDMGTVRKAPQLNGDNNRHIEFQTGLTRLEHNQREQRPQDNVHAKQNLDCGQGPLDLEQGRGIQNKKRQSQKQADNDRAGGQMQGESLKAINVHDGVSSETTYTNKNNG